VYCDSMMAAVLIITLTKDVGKVPEDYTPELLEKYKNRELEDEFYVKAKENYDKNSAYVSWSNFGWVSFYDFFTRIKVIDNEDFNHYQTLIESNVFECYEFEHAVYAVQPPQQVIYNENLLPHNVEGPSVVFRDGSGFYHVMGMPMEEELFFALKNNTYTFTDWLKEENEEPVSFRNQNNGNSTRCASRAGHHESTGAGFHQIGLSPQPHCIPHGSELYPLRPQCLQNEQSRSILLNLQAFRNGKKGRRNWKPDSRKIRSTGVPGLP
jgi:hypothetical protein